MRGRAAGWRRLNVRDGRSTGHRSNNRPVLGPPQSPVGPRRWAWSISADGRAAGPRAGPALGLPRRAHGVPTVGGQALLLANLCIYFAGKEILGQPSQMDVLVGLESGLPKI